MKAAKGITLDTATVLGKARRILWALQRAGKAIDPGAAAAVTVERHGKAGRAFAARIMEAVGPDAGEAAVDAAILQALRGSANLRVLPAIEKPRDSHGMPNVVR